MCKDYVEMVVRNLKEEIPKCQGESHSSCGFGEMILLHFQNCEAAS